MRLHKMSHSQNVRSSRIYVSISVHFITIHFVLSSIHSLPSPLPFRWAFLVSEPTLFHQKRISNGLIYMCVCERVSIRPNFSVSILFFFIISLNRIQERASNMQPTHIVNQFIKCLTSCNFAVPQRNFSDFSFQCATVDQTTEFSIPHFTLRME